jgi:RNA polymerase sigma-70 factor (ECF subfamily)
MESKGTDKISDEELFALYKNSGNEKYFRGIYDRYAKRIYAYCLRAMPDTETARDIFQKVWATIVEKKSDFSGGNFLAWLMVITRNFCLMEKRQRKYTDEIDENTLIVNDSEKNDFILKEVIMKEIKRLPEDMAEIILLKYFDEFSYKEIASILGIQMSLVKVRLFRAKKMLSKSLAFLKEN